MDENVPLLRESPTKNNTDASTDISNENVSYNNIFRVVMCMYIGVAVYTFSITLYNLVMPQYCYSYYVKYLFPNSSEFSDLNGSCVVDKTSDNQKERDSVQEATTTVLLYSSFVANIPSIVTIVFLGSLSDRYGRKLLLNIIFTGGILQGLIYILLMHFNVYLYILLIGTGIGSITGGYCAAVAISFAYLSDLTMAGKQRIFVIVLVSIGLGIGETLAGFVSGYLVDYLGYMYTIVLAVGFLLLTLLFINVFVKESRSKEIRSLTSVTENIRNMFRLFTQVTSYNTNCWHYVICMSTFVLACFATISKDGIDPIYQLNTPFCWSSVWIGWYAAMRCLINCVIGGGTMAIFKAFVKVSEKYIAILSCLSNIGACVLQALAYNDLMLFLVPLTGSLSSLVLPILRSIMSGMTPPNQQGALFSGIAVMEMFAVLVCDSSSKAIYRATIETYRGAVYFVIGGYDVLAIFLLLVFIIGTKSTHSPEITTQVNVESNS